jgi:hypothetical protein
MSGTTLQPGSKLSPRQPAKAEWFFDKYVYVRNKKFEFDFLGNPSQNAVR